MASSIVRGGRRRRVLNEEVRATSHLAITAVASDHDREADEVCRYGEQAHVENHPQITDFIPRRVGTVAAMLTVGLVVAGAAQAMTAYAETISAAVPGLTADVVTTRLAGGVVAWSSAVVLVIAAAAARVIFSLRRHRVDDVRGRYLVWKWAAFAATFWSFNAVVQLQDVIGQIAVACGWGLSASGVEWWLAPSLIVGGWIAVQTTRDLAESRAALITMSLALVCIAAATVGSAGGAAAAPPIWQEALVGAVPLVGHLFLTAALLLYARYVVLDVQGLIEHKPERSAAIRAAATPPSADASPTDDPVRKGAEKREPEIVPVAATKKGKRAKAEGQSERPQDDAKDRWVDGRGPEAAADSDSDEAPRTRMSKAQRKRLRKQKARNRAA
ncbi:MAG: hypothetical protein AAF961_06645 [Planctomycetota bacterium]